MWSLQRSTAKDLPGRRDIGRCQRSLHVAQLSLGNPEIERFVMQMLALNYLDLVFDCQETDGLDAIKDNSLDERELQCCDSFPLGPLAPYRTWSPEESHRLPVLHFLYCALFSTDLAISRRFRPNPHSTLMLTD